MKGFFSTDELHNFSAESYILLCESVKSESLYKAYLVIKESKQFSLKQLADTLCCHRVCRLLRRNVPAW